MAEDWVLKGSLKGPQGKPGETPDLSEYLTLDSSNNLRKDGSAVPEASVYNSTGAALLAASASSGNIDAQLIADAPYNSGSFRARGFGTDYNASISATANRSGGASITASSTATSDGGESHSLSIGVSQYGSYIGADDNPTGGIYAADVANPDTANGNRVPNLNNVRSLVAAKMAPDDVVAGENVSVSVGETGTVTISAEPGLPAGGTEGQVLTKTADGEAWQDVPKADMTGVLKVKNDQIPLDIIYKTDNGGQESPVSSVVVMNEPGNTSKPYAYMLVDDSGSSLMAQNYGRVIGFVVGSEDTQFVFDSKSVTSITDAISSTDSARADELVTGKAVADYVAENAPSVDTSNLVSYNASTNNLERYTGGRIDELTIPSTTNSDRCVSISSDQVSRIVVAETSSKGVTISSDMDTSRIVIDGYSNLFQMGSKYVLSITDDASGGSDSALVTAKAVADAIPTAADPDELVAYVKNYGGGA